MPRLSCKFGLSTPDLELPRWLRNNGTSRFDELIEQHWNLPIRVRSDTRRLAAPLSGYGRNGPAAWELHEDLRVLLGEQPVPLPAVGVLVCDFYQPKESVLGIMFDPGFPFEGSPENDADQLLPREGCAIFLDAIRNTRNDFENQSLRTSMHEFGHLLNLEHIEQYPGIMRSSEIGQDFTDESWRLTSDHHQRLQALERQDSACWPGGHQFGDTGFATGDDPWGWPRRAHFGLELKIDVARHRFHYYDPIELDIRLVTAGGLGGEVEVPDTIDPGFDSFRVWIEEPDGTRRALKSPRHYCANGDCLKVTPDRPFLRDISLFGQSGGYTFRRAGVHRIWVELALSSTEKLASPAIEVDVLARRHDDERRRALLTSYPSQVLLYHRRLLRRGRRLRAFLDERSNDPACDGIRYALARAKLPEKTGKRSRRKLSDELARLSQSPWLGHNQRRLATQLASAHRPERTPRSEAARTAVTGLAVDAPKRLRE